MEIPNIEEQVLHQVNEKIANGVQQEIGSQVISQVFSEKSRKIAGKSSKLSNLIDSVQMGIWTQVEKQTYNQIRGQVGTPLLYQTQAQVPSQVSRLTAQTMYQVHLELLRDFYQERQP